jgi:hypothetical protein
MLEIRTRKGELLWGKGPAIGIAALATIIAGAALYYRSSLLPMIRLDEIQSAEYLFVLFASMALIALYAGFAESWQLHRLFVFPGLIFPSTALLFAGVYKLGMHQFGGWDEDLLVHAATYYTQGLRPYLDFPCTMPPLFMATIRWSVKLLGLRWSSFALIPATFSALTSLWIFGLLRRVAVRPHWALVVTICVEMCTMLMEPFWWYNNASCIAVVLLFLSVLACLQRQSPMLSWISLCLSLAIVLASKPNVAPACLMVAVLFLAEDKRQCKKTLLACAGALVLAVLVCYAAQMPPDALLHSYAEAAKLRGSPLSMIPFKQLGWPEGVFQGIFVVVNALSFIALLVISAKRRPGNWRVLSVCAIAALSALLMACTNADLKNSDLSILLVAVCILCLCPWEMKDASAGRKTVLASWLCVFLVMAGFFSVIHLRVLLIGEGLYYEPVPTKTIQGGFFSGLEAGPRLQRVLHQTGEVLSILPSERVFFGPRLEFAYAAFGKPVTPGMPLVWDAGNLFSPARIPSLLLTIQKRDPDLLIFKKGDYTGMGLAAFYITTSEAYQRINNFSELTVYVRKKEVPVTYIRIPAGTPTF